MTPENRTGRPKGIGPKSVLVVEDDASILKLLQIVLEQNAFVVRQATTYAEATVAIEDAEPSLIVLDIGLPDGNGLDLLKWVRDDLGKSMPILVLSAFGQEAKAARAYELGANDFVAKPFRPKELVSRIRRVMDV